MLCESLRHTGAAGRPRERFDDRPEVYQRYMCKLAAKDEADYLQKVLEVSTTTNGLCGIKLHWHQLPVIEAAIRASHAAAEEKQFSCLLAEHRIALFGYPKVIWLRRLNRLEQAISLYRASRSRIWHRSISQRRIEGEPVSYDFEAIAALVRRCEMYDRQWQFYIDALGIPALPVWYEVLCSRYHNVMRIILDFLDLPHVSVAPQTLEKLGDDETAQWASRFRQEQSANSRYEACP